MPHQAQLSQPDLAMQSRRMALAEAITNVTIGFVFAIGVQAAIFPLVGLTVTFGENLLIGAAFTVASVIRSYVLRRITYAGRDQAREDREQQERLLAALDAAPSQMGRDEAGWWIIAGRRGTIQTWGDGESWLVYVGCRSRQHWTFTKRRLPFMTVTQDGDEEGCLRLFRMPSPHEAVVIREAMGLRKRVAYAPGALERKRASMAKAGLARGTASASVPDLATPDAFDGDSTPEGGPVVERERVPEAEEVLS